MKTNQEIIKINIDDFRAIKTNSEILENIREKIIAGDIIIVRGVIQPNLARSIVQSIISDERIKEASDAKVKDGSPNFKFTSSFHKKESTQYSAIDKSWYFFPWNPDELGLFRIFQDVFELVIKMNRLDPKFVFQQKPSDSFYERMHLIYYPLNSGEISLHVDPDNIVKVVSGIYLSQHGLDYKDGGFYVLDKNKQKKLVDKEVSIGDMVLFSPRLAHGVSPPLPVEGAFSKQKGSGRYFLTMNLVQSHMIQDRETATGIDL